MSNTILKNRYSKTRREEDSYAILSNAVARGM